MANNKFSSYEITSFAEFISIIEKIRTKNNDSDLWYRGHKSSSYKLDPSIYRNPRYSKIVDIESLEIKLYQEFSFRSPSYDFSRREDQWDILFLMQHYRVPTRLLDWTSSPLIALYFALSSHSGAAKTDAAVWAIEPASWNCGMLHDISEEPRVFSTEDDTVDQYHPKYSGGVRRAEPLVD